MRAALLLAVAGVCAWVCAAQAPATAGKKAPPSRAPAKSTSTAKTTSTARAPAKGTSATARKSTTSRKTTPVKTAFKPRQAQPTTERYQEIQNALVTKGYLRPEQATGAWDQNSIDGLKRFQAEQKLDASGKITSMSLIALGLGPRHDPATMVPTSSGNFN